MYTEVWRPLTQVKMEKKENVMAARAASPPSLSGLSSCWVTCHWFAKKQKPTNHMKDQNAGERERETGAETELNNDK